MRSLFWLLLGLGLGVALTHAVQGRRGRALDAEPSGRHALVPPPRSEPAAGEAPRPAHHPQHS